MKKFSVVLIAALLLALSTISHADSWLEPKLLSGISDNGTYVVRVNPNTDDGSADIGVTASAKAEARWYRFDGDKYVLFKSKLIDNPVSPNLLSIWIADSFI